MKFIFIFLTHILLLSPLFAQDSIPKDKLYNQPIESELDEYNEYFFQLKKLNDGLPKQDVSGNLQTPYKTLSFFERNIKNKNYELAASALNFNLIPIEDRLEKRKTLPQELYYLLKDKGLLAYDNLPNRADGLIEPPVGGANKLEGTHRKSILIGKIKLDEKNIPIYIERVKTNDSAPMWIFSAETVEFIEALYERYKPAEYEKHIPQWLKRKVWGINLWEIIILCLTITITYTIGWLIVKGIKWGIDKFTDKEFDKKDFDVENLDNNSIVYFFDLMTIPFIVMFTFTLLYLSSEGVVMLSIIEDIAKSIKSFIDLGFALSLAWFLIRLISFITNYYRYFRIESIEDEETQQLNKRKTNITTIEKVLKAFITVWTIIYIASLFMDISGIGRIFLTSAGILGVVLGFAAQSIIGNFIAGVQVAFTKPVKVGDIVMVKGEWCTIDDLRYTYAILKTWDSRRLIIPMKYLVDEIIENWSHTDLHTESGVFLYVDYTADVEKIREYFLKIVKEHPLWDKVEEPELLVSDNNKETFTLRGKVSSDTPNNVWKMECDIREKMLAYISEKDEILPKERVVISKKEN